MNMAGVEILPESRSSVRLSRTLTRFSPRLWMPRGWVPRLAARLAGLCLLVLCVAGCQTEPNIIAFDEHFSVNLVRTPHWYPSETTPLTAAQNKILLDMPVISHVTPPFVAIQVNIHQSWA